MLFLNYTYNSILVYIFSTQKKYQYYIINITIKESKRSKIDLNGSFQENKFEDPY